ncbi:MAG: TolB family protein [Candidatus Neomarinimicrobiota bacterium]
MEWFEIYILDKSGNHRYRLTWNGQHPVWSPDGKQIAFERQDAIGNYEGIYIIDADGTDERRLNRDPYTIVHIWDWSDDGQRLLVTGEKYVAGSSRPESYELYEMDLNGNLIKQITDTKDIREYDAKWSSDNKKIAYSTVGLYRDIYIISPDSANPELITPSGDNKIGSFRWSPDALRIAFTQYGQFGRDDQRKEWANIHVINTDGTGLTQITFDDSTDIINNVTDWR